LEKKSKEAQDKYGGRYVGVKIFALFRNRTKYIGTTDKACILKTMCTLK